VCYAVFLFYKLLQQGHAQTIFWFCSCSAEDRLGSVFSDLCNLLPLTVDKKREARLFQRLKFVSHFYDGKISENA